MLAKKWLLFLASTAALSVTGVAYAAWTGSLHVEGQVATASVEAVWERVEARDFVLVKPRGGREAHEERPDERDAAQCTVLTEPGQGVRSVVFTLSDAYPGYGCRITLGARVTGSVPVQVTRVAAQATDAGGRDILGAEIDMDVSLTRRVAQNAASGVLVCNRNQELEPGQVLQSGDRFCGIISVIVRPDSKMRSEYFLRAAIDLTQWNLSGVTASQAGPRN